MNGNISLGQYFPGDSALHRADPRTKILLSIAFMTLAFMADDIEEFAVLFAFVALAGFATGIPLMIRVRAIKPVLPLIVFASIINIFMVPGEEFFRVWLIAPTREGLVLALRMAARVSLIILGGSSLMILTTTPIMLTDGVEKLLKPLKRFHVPVHELAMMMTIALRFIPTLIEEADKIMRAQASRGSDFNEGSLLSRAKSFLPIIIPLFVSAFRRADELANAMEARCYRGDEGRTRLRQLRMVSLDARLFAAVGVLFVIFFLPRAITAIWLS